MAKYILFTGGNGYCGCDFEDVLFYWDDVDEDTLSADAWAMAEDNAQTYSHVRFGWGEDYDDEEWEDYIENYVHCNWEEITREQYLKWCEGMGYTPATEEEVKKDAGEF